MGTTSVFPYFPFLFPADFLLPVSRFSFCFDSGVSRNKAPACSACTGGLSSDIQARR
ncbi:hypothetical protein [Cupriavidus pinatubonensis]|uniref:hypothetical protein n=1 Tax=Cupriavidus pinatubonensis TaxID=248026 RepID=UPI001CC361F0|nr:hypothetical protein [Cupriavidus pinatubonensis]